MINDEEMLIFEIERFASLCNPFGWLDIREALRFGRKFNLDANKIIDLAEQFSKDCGIPFEELDIVYIVYEHVLQDARDRIYKATGYDFINDCHSEISTYGNFMATTYDYTEEARERLIAELAALDREKIGELLDSYLLRFLEYIDITKEDIKRKVEALQEEILTEG